LCVIVKKGDKYYWKSRENKQLLKMDSGAFTYFIAPTSGYVKFIKRAVRIGQKWGGIDPKGKIIIEPKFDKMSDFSNGKTWVTNSDGVFLMNKRGKFSVSLIYDVVGSFCDGLCSYLFAGTNSFPTRMSLTVCYI